VSILSPFTLPSSISPAIPLYLPSLPPSLYSAPSLPFSGPHPLKPARGSEAVLKAPQRNQAEPGCQMVSVHSEVKNTPLVSVDSGAEEV